MKEMKICPVLQCFSLRVDASGTMPRRNKKGLCFFCDVIHTPFNRPQRSVKTARGETAPARYINISGGFSMMMKKIVVATSLVFAAAAANADTLYITDLGQNAWKVGNPFLVTSGLNQGADSIQMDKTSIGTIGGSITTNAAGVMTAGTVTWTGTLTLNYMSNPGGSLPVGTTRVESHATLTGGSLDLVTGVFTATSFGCTNDTYASNDIDICLVAADSPPGSQHGSSLAFWNLSDYGPTSASHYDPMDPTGTTVVPAAPTTPGGLVSQSHTAAGVYTLKLFDNSANVDGWGGFFTPKSQTANLIITTSVNPPAAVPVPAALWLMGSGLAGLGVFGRRKKVTA